MTDMTGVEPDCAELSSTEAARPPGLDWVSCATWTGVAALSIGFWSMLVASIV